MVSILFKAVKPPNTKNNATKSMVSKVLNPGEKRKIVEENELKPAKKSTTDEVRYVSFPYRWPRFKPRNSHSLNFSEDAQKTVVLVNSFLYLFQF